MVQFKQILCALASIAAAAAVTLPNYNYKLDSAGNLIDAHDGKLYYFDGKYYLYGTSYNCGFRWRTSNFTSPFCGFKCYSSTDLLTWQDEGFLFDASTKYWQEACADTAACFRPKVLRNPTNGEYVMWMNSGASTYSYTVFNSSSPVGPFVELNKPVMPYARGNTSYGNGDFGITIGPDGVGYIAYDTTPFVTGPPLFSNPNITFGIVQRLTPDYKATEDEYIVTGLANIEAWDMFWRDGWWYLTFGHICGYCDSTDTSYIKSRDPLGPWLEADRFRITDSSCGGQHTMVAQLPRAHTAAGDDYLWLYGSDTWTSDVNEGKAGLHWEPLKFAEDGSIAPLDCYASSYDVPVKTSSSDVIDVMKTATVASRPGNYTWNCDLGTKHKNFLFQFFQAPKSGNVTEFGFNLAQQANNFPLNLYFGAANTKDVSELYTSAGGIEVLWHDTIPTEDLGWALPMLTVQPNAPVVAGNYYAIYASTSGGSIPYCYMERVVQPDLDPETQQPSTFMAAVQQGRYPLFPVPDREMNFFVRID
ncbi:hypothetical protein AC578_2222 [Pseudocercospora eumusae]|uniref:Beta-xylosidase C-terminal Concanavalin A-like domain-containing protein n=1 Tax=Pseudocercospora eumusae TaxID=321146 RepID=A0A139HAW6_9PEZI|nr:hypothetical protein AC578_2222 [Pseudocercospora eumusae]